MNPFDPKSVLLAKHAQHVALVHFPIALIFVSVLFDLLSLRKQSLALLRAAYYTVIVAAISAVPTIATGLLAWQFQLEGARLKGNLRLHLILALCSSAMIWLVCWLHAKEQRKPQFNSPGGPPGGRAHRGGPYDVDRPSRRIRQRRQRPGLSGGVMQCRHAQNKSLKPSTLLKKTRSS